eukprot:12438490-Prorocentrum_lima.AAC.1
MTSSLVGSEMCIRDSQGSAFGITPPSTPCTPLAGHQTSIQTTRHSSKTVSYTHLTLPTICSV